MQLGSGKISVSEFKVGGLELDDKTKEFMVDGELVNLTPTEFEIMKLFMERPGEVISPKEVYRKVWKEEPFGADSTVAVLILLIATVSIAIFIIGISYAHDSGYYNRSVKNFYDTEVCRAISSSSSYRIIENDMHKPENIFKEIYSSDKSNIRFSIWEKGNRDEMLHTNFDENQTEYIDSFLIDGYWIEMRLTNPITVEDEFFDEYQLFLARTIKFSFGKLKQLATLVCKFFRILPYVWQVAGEYKEKLEDVGLELILNAPEDPVSVLGNGRHLWRIFDNLLNNICKYSQEKTRVYLTLEEREGKDLVIFRNISKYPLNITSDEWMERFVRGDTSRHTEGSGLGLSIAKSLVELQKGKMDIVIDGDLFKVILEFDLCN